VEVEAMSRRTSPSTHRPYGIARVLRVWALPRSTFYAQREGRAQPATGRRGRTPTLDDPALLAQIRAVIAESPFHGEGHRKIWARLRALKGVRTSMRRVLRVMRDAELLAPARQPEPVVDHPHDGTIVTDRPNVMWGTDATAAVTRVDGTATIFAAIDHCTAECVGIHAARDGDRFEALEPLRQGVRDHFGPLAAAAAPGLALRHDHGSVYLSADFQTEITFLGMTPSPAFVRQPEGKDYASHCTSPV
jgi:putative transposase